MMDVKVGDEVFVHDVNGHRRGQPEHGWPGEVVEVRRTLFTVKVRGQMRTFRLENGVENDKFGHRSVKTREQMEAGQRHSAALADLKAHGISLTSGHHLTAGQLEALAEVARTFKQEV